jgi:hypothetical protein
MWEVTFYTNIKWKECLIYWWMKHSTASGTSHAVSHKIKASFLKTAQNSFPRLTYDLAVLKFLWFNKQWAVWHCAVQKKSANLTASNSSQHVHLQYGKTALCLALKSKRYHNHVDRIFTIKNCKQGNFPLVYNGKKSNCHLMCIITPKIIVIFNTK